MLRTATLILLVGIAPAYTVAVDSPEQTRTAAAAPSSSAAVQAQLKSANDLFAAGKYEQAKLAYLRIAPSFKDDFQFNKQLAYCFFVSRKSEMDQAARYYGRAHAIRPTDRETEINWAKSLSWSKQYKAATAAFRAILVREPQNHDILLELARAQKLSGDAQAARATYESILRRWPGDRDAHLEFAVFLSGTNHLDEALQAYRQILKSEPASVPARVGEGQVLAWQGQLPQALAAFDLALKRAPKNYDALRGKAFALLWLQRYDEAEPVFAQANRVKPPDAEMQQAERQIARWKADAPAREHQAQLQQYLHPADLAIARNDLPAAIDMLKKAVAVAPQDQQVRFRLGEAYLWNQQWTDAIDVFHKLTADFPAYLPALRELGNAQAGAKQLTQAAETFRAYLQRSPDNDVRLQLARVLSWSGQLDEARKTYEELLANQPANFDAALGMAQTTAWQGKTDEAVEQFNVILKQRPGNRDALLGKAQVLSWAGRSDEAIPILEEMRTAAPNDREIASVLESVQEAARQLKEQQEAAAAGRAPIDVDQRIHSYEEVLKQNPSSETTLERLGDLYSQKKDYASAESYYSKALAQRPGDATLQLTLARTAAWGRDYARSVEVYRALVTQSPDNRDYRMELAKTLSWAGRNAESIAEYREVLQRNPKDTEAQLLLARVLSWDKRLDESLAEYAKVLQADPTNRQAFLEEARVYSWKGELSTALKMYDTVLINAPTDRDASIGKAQVLSWAGQPREAKAILDEFQKKYPNDRDLLLANAGVQASLGRRDLALRQLDDLDKLQPGNRDVEALRRTIRQDLRPTLVVGVTPSSDSQDLRIYATTATVYFSPTPRIRSYFATNFLPTNDPVNGSEIGREFLFGSYGRVNQWLLLRGEIGANSATAGNSSPIGGGGFTVFAGDKMQFDFDVSRRFINYLPLPIRSDISRVQYRGVWNWHPARRTSFHIDAYRELYSDTNRNNGANFSMTQNLVRSEHFELEAGYLFAISWFEKNLNSGFFAPTSFQRHAALGNVRINFTPKTGVSFWGSLGREEVFDNPFRLDGTSRVSWDYKLTKQLKFSLGYGYFAISSIGGATSYVTHTGYSTLEYVF